MRRLLRLPPSDRALLLRAAVMLAAVRAGLWLLPHRLLRRFLSAIARPPSRGRHSPERVAWAVKVASRYVPGTGSCLPRALAAHVLIVRSGHQARLRLGVARAVDGGFEAHAWVESDGEILIGALDELSRYAPLPAVQGGGL